MEKIGKPKRLIGYDTDINIERRERGEDAVYRFIRPRTMIYVVLILVVAGIMGWRLTTRATIGVNVLHDRNPLYVSNSDGSIRNGYTVRLLNKDPHDRDLILSVKGLPAGSHIDTASIARRVGDGLVFTTEADQTREIRIQVMVPPNSGVSASTALSFELASPTGEVAAAKDFFKAP
jgi:polyferredoxin